MIYGHRTALIVSLQAETELSVQLSRIGPLRRECQRVERHIATKSVAMEQLNRSKQEQLERTMLLQ